MNNHRQKQSSPALQELTGVLRTAVAEIRDEPVQPAILERVLQRARTLEFSGTLQHNRPGTKFRPYFQAPGLASPAVPTHRHNAVDSGTWYSRSLAWSRIGLAACAVLLVLSLFLSGNTRRVLAFADVQAQLQEVQSVTYLQKRMPSGGILEENRRVMVLGRYLEREEVHEKWANGQTLHWISITDYETGKNIVLRPAQKRAVILTHQVTRTLDGQVVNEEPIKPSPEVDIYKSIREIPAEATTRLPERTIDGKRVVGFYYEETKGSNTWKRTFWVDPTTKLPVRIEISHRNPHPNAGPSDWVQSDFEFDTLLDKSLFKTDPPEGYTVERKKIYGIAIP